MKPTNKQIEEMRKRIFAQSVEDIAASVGSPFHFLNTFDDIINDVYEQGLADGKRQMQQETEGLGIA